MVLGEQAGAFPCALLALPVAGGPAAPPLHPVPSCCLAEAAGQPAARKESCANRQEIEPGLAGEAAGARPVASVKSQLTLKSEAQSECGVQQYVCGWRGAGLSSKERESAMDRYLLPAKSLSYVINC